MEKKLFYAGFVLVVAWILAFIFITTNNYIHLLGIAGFLIFILSEKFRFIAEKE